MESSLALLQGRWKALVLWHLTSLWIIFITDYSFHDLACAFVMTVVAVVMMALIVLFCFALIWTLSSITVEKSVCFAHL